MVREYLESLKEDKELDYLFPILISLMGYKIISTPKDSKGQPQYGKDVVAIGIDSDGIKKRFYFELKGYSDKDIDDTIFMKPDGIRDSIIAAKDAEFNDHSIPGLNELPFKVVLVHNGTLKSNTRPILDGFIGKEFPLGNFERWDIHTLTDLFSQYLFSEYLLTDEQSILLFKRTLVLLDAPEYDYLDFKQLVDIQLEKVNDIKGRSFKKLFATLNLLSVIIVHYSNENNNLHPAKDCITYLILKTWSWILKNNLEKRKPVLNEFRKLINIHYDLIAEYLSKTLHFATQQDGLFAERGGPFETIGNPLRSFEYLNYLIYYFEARQYFPHFNTPPAHFKNINLRKKHKECLKKVIQMNVGTKRPLIDGHLIGLLNVCIFFLKNELTTEDRIFLIEYLNEIFSNIVITQKLNNRFPELHNNIKALIDFLTLGERPSEYEDRSSLLITILFELSIVLKAYEIYDIYKEHFVGKIDLQVADTELPIDKFEQLLFEKKLHDEYFVESSIELPNKATDFSLAITNKIASKREYRTDKAGFAFLRLLAHIYFQNEMLPEEWRKFLLV